MGASQSRRSRRRLSESESANFDFRGDSEDHLNSLKCRKCSVTRDIVGGFVMVGNLMPDEWDQVCEETRMGEKKKSVPWMTERPFCEGWERWSLNVDNTICRPSLQYW